MGIRYSWSPTVWVVIFFFFWSVVDQVVFESYCLFPFYFTRFLLSNSVISMACLCLSFKARITTQDSGIKAYNHAKLSIFPILSANHWSSSWLIWSGVLNLGKRPYSCIFFSYQDLSMYQDLLNHLTLFFHIPSAILPSLSSLLHFTLFTSYPGTRIE
jgi:hypothetical protein